MVFYEDRDIFKNEKDYMFKNPVRRYFQRLLDRKILGHLEVLIAEARNFGLPESDIKNALTYIEYNEFEVSFDIIAEQMYEYEIKIDKEFYDLAMEICETLKIHKKKYQFLEELIENDKNAQKIVKNKK